jgi:glucose/arabinose dehydrogenase
MRKRSWLWAPLAASTGLARQDLQRQPCVRAIVVAARRRDAGHVLDAGDQPVERDDYSGDKPLDARVRDVRQGPDGYIYISVERDLQNGPGSARLTEDGSIIRIEPLLN